MTCNINVNKMATCFGPLPPSRRQFDVHFPPGRPPRYEVSHRPPRVQRTRTHACGNVRNSDDLFVKRFLSSTYRSFRDANEDEISFPSGESGRKCRSVRCRKRTHVCRRVADDDCDNRKRRTFSFDEDSMKMEKARRDRSRLKTMDGYYSDTSLLPGKVKPFLSTFKSDDNNFEHALLSTLKEKSKSSQNLACPKKPVMSPRLKVVSIPSADLVIPKLEKSSFKRSVTFSEQSKPDFRCKFSVLGSELPSLTFEQLRNAANTKHPKCLYSTNRYPELHLTVFCGNERISPPIRTAEEAHILGIDKPRYLNHTSSSLRRRKALKQTTFAGKLFRSQSEGNLAQNTGSTPKSESQLTLGTASFNKCLRVLSGSWRNLLNCKCCLF